VSIICVYYLCVLSVKTCESNAQELGDRSRALMERLRSHIKAHEIEDVEHRILIAVKNNKLLQSQRPTEFIKRSGDSRSVRLAI
jgi:hypothetical protein